MLVERKKDCSPDWVLSAGRFTFVGESSPAFVRVAEILTNFIMENPMAGIGITDVSSKFLKIL